MFCLWALVQMEGVITTTLMQWSEVVIELFQLMFMSQAVRQQLKHFFMEFFSYRTKFEELIQLLEPKT